MPDTFANSKRTVVEHDNWAIQRPTPRFLRGVYPWGEYGDKLLPVIYLIHPRNDHWTADEYDINIQDSRVLVVVQKSNGLPVKFYNADLWESITQYVKIGMAKYTPTRLLLLTQDEIDRWDERKGEVTPHPVAPGQ